MSAMSTSRKVILVVTLALIGLAGLVPPWSYTYQPPGAPRTWKPAPRGFLLAPPGPERRYAASEHGVSLDVRRLCVEWLVIVVLGAAAFLAAGLFPGARRAKKADPPRDQP